MSKFIFPYGYLVVIGYENTKNMERVLLCEVDSQMMNANPLGWLDLNVVASMSVFNHVPLNFSVDRDGKVRMDCGDFSRFSRNGSAVVLAELKSQSGKHMGYRLLSCAKCVITNMKDADILQRELSYGDEHFLQNGIIRNNAISCYPRKPFKVVTMTAMGRSNKEGAKKPESVRKAPKKVQLTPEQVSELKKCEAAGVDPRFLRNPKLSQNQMRVLWVSKSKGALSEYFANPAMSTDAMKFYADRLYSKEIVDECSELLKHPELSVDELTELYGCICDDVPYRDLIGKSATDIATSREISKAKYWGSSSLFDTDYFEKAMNVARKMKGY